MLAGSLTDFLSVLNSSLTTNRSLLGLSSITVCPSWIDNVAQPIYFASENSESNAGKSSGDGNFLKLWTAGVVAHDSFSSV